MNIKAISVAAVLLLFSGELLSQTIYKYEQRDSLGRKGATLTFFSKNLSHYIPHIVRQYEAGKALHAPVWQLAKDEIQSPFIMLTDWEDDGNGGAAPLPVNTINIGMAPVNMSYYVGPITERYSHLFRHEYTHIVMTDRPTQGDAAWRRLFGTKVLLNNQHPLTAVWSYLTVPRWYSPRWYHEGIACFMETWLAGGLGRALGGYDEMYFRSIIHDGERMSTVVGLESEGSTKDFQVGANAYLYGTRFVNYLTFRYGYDKLIDFYNRTQGSSAFFATQFKKVYGRHLRHVWSEWQEYEKEHQRENLALISHYPITETEKINAEMKSYGSASPLIVDDSLQIAYTAVNYPGDLPHIERIDLNTGKRRKVANIDESMLYQTAYLTLDKRRQRLIWTDRNYGLRSICTLDLKTGKKTRSSFRRTSNIVYDNANDCLYGLLSHEGVTYLVRYEHDLGEPKILYTFKFGVSVTDLDVSHDGTRVVMNMIGLRGQNSLIMFNVADLENANYNYTTIHHLDDSNLTQFRFSEDDKKLVGCSYYTGVSNVWEISLDSLSTGKKAEPALLSNTETGLFAPYLTRQGTVFAFKFTRDGMMPVRFGRKVIEDCNAIELLGQKAYEKNTQLGQLSKARSGMPNIEFGEVYDSIKVYRTIGEMRFRGAYPDITGFRDRDAWNRVTPVLGYNMAFSDPLSLSALNISLGVSPWSNNAWKNRFHASMDWTYWNWTLNASWNRTNFYDLFGPTQRSRKGYDVGIGYERTNGLKAPFRWSWGFAVNTYGDMDVLPLYQNVEVDKGIHSMQTIAAHIGASKIRSTLGAVVAEHGYRYELEGYSYLAGGRLFPTVTASGAWGTTMPFMRNTSGWLYVAAGQNFGDDDSSLGNSYFGGFKNNYIDNGSVYRYRTIGTMPGTEIDAISAHSFLKATAELNLQPVRFRNVGMLCMYPTFAQLSLFSTDLMANPWGGHQFNNFVNIGAQLNVEVVLFNYMKTTWSVGYARIFNQSSSGFKRNSGELLLSLKLF